MHPHSFGIRQTPRKQFCSLSRRLYAPGDLSTRSIVVSGRYLQDPNRPSSQPFRRVGSVQSTFGTPNVDCTVPTIPDPTTDNISPVGHLTRSAAGLTQPLIRYLSRPTCRSVRSPQPPDIHSDVGSTYCRLRRRQIPRSGYKNRKAG